jgi:hypothetical protein
MKMRVTVFTVRIGSHPLVDLCRRIQSVSRREVGCGLQMVWQVPEKLRRE